MFLPRPPHELLLPAAHGCEYTLSLLPAPQYSRLLPEQSMLHSEAEPAGTEPALNTLPQ